MPRTSGTQLMPMMAPGPPDSLLNSTVGQCCSSPISRRIVTASVMTAGMRISLAILGEGAFAMKLSFALARCAAPFDQERRTFDDQPVALSAERLARGCR